MRKFRELIDQIDINKILEKHSIKENKENKNNNANLFKENEKLAEEIGKLKRKSDLICKHAFKWLKEKNMWKKV